MIPHFTKKEAEILEDLAERRGFHTFHKVGRKYFDNNGQRVYNAQHLHAIVQVHKSKKDYLKFLLNRKIN